MPDAPYVPQVPPWIRTISDEERWTPPPPPPLTHAEAMALPLRDAADWWFGTECQCGAICTPSPRALAITRPHATVGEVAALLRCRVCRGWPAVGLCQDIYGEVAARQRGQVPGWRLPLLLAGNEPG